MKQPVKDFVLQRHHSIRKEIQEVRQDLKTAQEKYEEFSSKLKAVDTEVAALRTQTQQEIAALKQRILSNSAGFHSISLPMLSLLPEGLYLELKGQLYSDLSHQVLERAEILVRAQLTGEDRNFIQSEFSKQLEAV
ncbi:unnamed protein product [Sphagnum tenellum]